MNDPETGIVLLALIVLAGFAIGLGLGIILS